MGEREVFFILHTNSADSFAEWLQATWKGYVDDRESLSQLRVWRGLPRKLTSDGMFATKPNSEGIQTAYSVGTVVTFTLLPLPPDRLEVRSTCSEGLKREEYWIGILQAIAERWPAAFPEWASIRDAESTPAMIGDAESTPAMIGNAESTPAPQESDFDEDAIPRFGTRRDLSTREVREIVRQCKAYKKKQGGSARGFWDEIASKRFIPEGPQSFSLGALNGWLRDPRFS